MDGSKTLIKVWRVLNARSVESLQLLSDIFLAYELTLLVYIGDNVNYGIVN